MTSSNFQEALTSSYAHWSIESAVDLNFRSKYPVEFTAVKSKHLRERSFIKGIPAYIFGPVKL